MADNRSRDADPFYFSDSIRDIDEEAPFILLKLYEQERSPIALLCLDTTSGEESIYAGYVKKTDYEVLEIEMPDHREAVISMINADFYPMERADAPSRLKAVTTPAYNVGMRFHTGKLKGYLLVQYVSGGK